MSRWAESLWQYDACYSCVIYKYISLFDTWSATHNNTQDTDNTIIIIIIKIIVIIIIIILKI